MKRILKLILVLLLFTSFTSTETTLKGVYKELITQDVKHPEIVIRQVIEETGWLKCTKCSRDKNNLFGMTTVIYVNGVKKRVHARYSDWKKSVTAYKKWQTKLYKDEDKDYYEFLDCLYTTKENRCVRYAVNPKYTSNLKILNINDILK